MTAVLTLNTGAIVSMENRTHKPNFVLALITTSIVVTIACIVYVTPSAAHSVQSGMLSETDSVFTMTVASDSATEFLSGTEWSPAIEAWVSPRWPIIQDATWIWKSELVTPEEARDGSAIISFRRLFYLPSDIQDLVGTVMITADNAYELSLNGVVIGQDGTLDPNAYDWSFQTIETYTLDLQPGWNELRIRAVNHKSSSGSSDPYANPAGVVFRADITGVVGSVSGRITAPTGNITIGPSTLLLRADAWTDGSTEVKHVEFLAFYDGSWHPAGLDAIPPYEIAWQTPNLLRSQELMFAIHVVDEAGTIVEFVDIVRGISYLESLGNPDVEENWIPTRAYLNQRSLQPNGDSKCSAASMAMALAMNGLIAWDYATLSEKADEMYPKVLKDGVAYVYLITAELERQGMDAEHNEYEADEGWTTLKQEIDEGRPVIVRTQHGVVTAAGHFFVAVGYRETVGSRQIITYDPFGRWLGSCCTNNYDKNTREATSHKGQWVSYDFDLAFGASNWLITGQPDTRPFTPIDVSSIPTTRPDLTSDEPENIGTYPGVEISTNEAVFLPAVLGN
ncbi:MAG: C39 family peptidase [Anaerolineae bacterium]|nr:C39 family peptidase [Anaerolineae bacterium]